MADFARALPALRRKLRADLASAGLNRDKVLALLVSLLDHTGMRVGNEEYARENRTYGLTTLLDRHAKVTAGRLALRFSGKGGKWHDLQVSDKNLANIVRRCQQLRGQDLFQYLNDDGRRRPVDSGMVNDYLQATMRDTFTAKDFRGWYATVNAVSLFALRPVPENEREITVCIGEVISSVASELRHTVAVCRKSYINPAVIEAWRSGRLMRLAAAQPNRTRSQRERLTLKILGRSKTERRR